MDILTMPEISEELERILEKHFVISFKTNEFKREISVYDCKHSGYQVIIVRSDNGGETRYSFFDNSGFMNNNSSQLTYSHILTMINETS